MSESYLSVRIESDALPPGVVRVFELEGEEEISRAFEFRVQMYAEHGTLIDGPALLGETATLVFERAGQPLRRVHGMISEVHDFGVTGSGNAAFRATFRPRVHALALTARTEIYLYRTLPDVLEIVLDRAGFERDKDYVLRLDTLYPRREFTMQYKETDLDFVSRLCEHLGVFYFWEHGGDRDVLVFTDRNAHIPAVPGGEMLQWVERDTVPGVQGFEVDTRMVPTTYRVADYNYRTPTVKLATERTVEKTGGGGTVYEHGDHFKTADEAVLIAKIRAQEVKCTRQVFAGRTNVPQLLAGAIFTMENHPRGDFALLLTRVRHEFHAGSALAAEGAESNSSYANEFSALLKAVDYRPPRRTPRPRVSGLLNAVVEDKGDGSPYAALDESGRYHVRFYFDRSPTPVGQATHPIRMAQPHVGPDYGMHFPLRAGREVVISFVDGDPDRPIIVGGVPNPLTSSPSHQQNAYENRLRSGQGNELRMNDTVGMQRVVLQSPHLNSVIQLGAMEHPEAGVYVNTDGHATTVAQQSHNTVTRQQRDLIENKATHALRSVVVTAGANLPGSALGHQVLQFEELSGLVRDAINDAREQIETLDDRKYHSLMEQLEQQKSQRADALERLNNSSADASGGSDDGAPSSPAADDDAPRSSTSSSSTSSGGDDGNGGGAEQNADETQIEAPSGQAALGIGDSIRQARQIELAALGIANGVAQQAGEALTDFARRVDRLRRNPLFGRIKKISAALGRVERAAEIGAGVANKVEQAIQKVEEATGATPAASSGGANNGANNGADGGGGDASEDGGGGDAQAATPSSQRNEDPMKVFREDPPQEEGESAEDYLQRLEDLRTQAVADMMFLNANGRLPALNELVPWDQIAENVLGEDAVKKIAKQMVTMARATPAEQQSSVADTPERDEQQEALTEYERTAARAEQVMNRLGEYWAALKDRPESLFRQTARKVLDDLEKRGQGDWGWGDVASVYTLLIEGLQRKRVGDLLQTAERVATSSSARAQRVTDEPLVHPDDVDGMVIHSARTVAAVVGEDAMLGADRAATVSSRGSVNIVGGAAVHVHAATTVELSGGSGVAFSSQQHLDLQSDESVSILGHPRGVDAGTDAEAVPARHSVLVRGKQSVLVESTRGSLHLHAHQIRMDESAPGADEVGDVTVEAGNEVQVAARKAVMVTSAEEDVIVTAATKAVRLHTLEKDIRFEAKTAIAMTATDEGITATAKKAVTVTTEDAVSITAKKGTTVTDDQQVVLKSGGASVTVKGGNVIVKGKLMLG